MFSSLFGIKSISSIQSDATKEIRKSVTAQLRNFKLEKTLC